MSPSGSGRPVRPKRLLFFDDRYYAAQGAQKLLVQLATYAADSGFDVTVGSTKPGALVDLADSSGLQTVVLGMPESLDRWGGELVGGSVFARLKSLAALLRQNYSIARQVRAHGFDLVWAAALRPMLSLLLTSVSGRIPVVWHIMGSGYFHGFSEVASLAATRIVLIANGLRPTVGALRSTRRVDRRIRIVQMGLQGPAELPDPRYALAANLRLPADAVARVWVVSIGAHIAEKGHLDVFRAVELLPHDIRNRVFLLIGGPPIAGEYHDNLVRAAKEAPEHVALHGWVDNVDPWLRAADVYVLASSREGMPLTLIEAMQRRAAPVAYSVGGVPELIVDGETGLLVHLGSVAGLADAIAKLVSDPILAAQIADNARAYVLENNSDDKMRERFGRVLSELIALPMETTDTRLDDIR